MDSNTMEVHLLSNNLRMLIHRTILVLLLLSMDRHQVLSITSTRLQAGKISIAMNGQLILQDLG